MNQYFCKIHSNNILRCTSLFHFLQIDASENRLMNIETKDLQKKILCDFALLKILIIRLRRQKYTEDWNLFKIVLHRNLDIILNKNIMGVRWFISFLDTYVDCGEETESANALIVVSFFKNETFFSTLLNDYRLKKIEYNFQLTRTFISFKTRSSSDTPDNFFRRLSNQLKKTPIIFKIFQKILRIALEDKETFLYKIADLNKKTNTFEPSIKKYFYNL